MINEKAAKKINRVIAKARVNAGFKEKLLADPTGTLKSEGIEVPKGIEFKAVENTEQIIYLTYHASALSDDDLQKISAGGSQELSPNCLYYRVAYCAWVNFLGEERCRKEKCPLCGGSIEPDPGPGTFR